MTDDEVSAMFRELAVRLAKPVLNGEVATPDSSVQGNDDTFTILWEHGYLPGRDTLRQKGASEPQIQRALAEFKRLGGIIEVKDLVQFSPNLASDIQAAFFAELPHEPPIAVFRLDERIVRKITAFRVEMFTDEGPHPGRPHVKVHLKSGAISISLDDPPVNLTPRGGLVGEASALKTIAQFRESLLAQWEDTRPDTQKLKDKFLEEGRKLKAKSRK